MPVAGTIDIGLSSNRIERELAAQLAAIEKRGVRLSFSDNGLGRITGQVGQFAKSIEAAEARVLAFSATAGSLYAITTAMKALFAATIDVEKSLADINVVLGRSDSGIKKFGAELFNIARDTGQAFSEVSKAALEFSRQGLGVEDTLKRTRDALVLTRLSGLDVVSSTEAITAVLNSFNETVADSTILVNKLAAVDAAFAVSSGDLAEGLKRVGAVAQDVGLSLDQTIGFITSLQQTTARGGANIGNSLKSIFQRVQRPETLELFDKLRIATEDTNGELLDAASILKNVADKFSSLDPVLKGTVSQLAAGTYQANAFRSIMRDLSKENSIFKDSTDKSNQATNEAIKRNKELNVTLSALLSRSGNTLKQFASQVGEQAISPFAKNFLGQFESLVGASTDDGTGQKLGAQIGKGISTGIGSFISGPGIAILGAIVLRLGAKLIKFAIESTKELLTFGKQIGANDGVLNSTLGKFEAIRQKIQASNELLIRQGNLLGQTSGIGGGSLSPRKGTGAIFSSQLGTSGYIPSYLSAPGQFQLPFSVPKPDISFKTSDLKKNISEAFPGSDPNLLFAFSGKSLPNASKSVAGLLSSLSKRVASNPGSYSSPQDQSSALSSFAAELNQIRSSSTGVLTGNTGFNVFSQSATSKAQAILSQAKLLSANDQTKSYNSSVLNDGVNARNADFRNSLVSSQSAAIIASRAKAVQREDRLRGIGQAAAFLAPIALGPAQDYFNSKDTRQGRAAGAAIGGVGQAISNSALTFALSGGNPFATIAAGATTLGIAGYNTLKEYNDKEKDIVKTIRVTAERISDITQIIDAIKDLDDKINQAPDGDIPELLSQRSQILSKGNVRGGLGGLNSTLGNLNNTQILNLTRLAVEKKEPLPSGILNLTGEDGGKLSDFLSSNSNIKKLEAFGTAGTQRAAGGALGLISGFGNRSLSELLAGLTFSGDTGGVQSFVNELVKAAKDTKKQGDDAKDRGRDKSAIKSALDIFLRNSNLDTLVGQSSISDKIRSNESSGRILDLFGEDLEKRATLRSADPIKILNLRRERESKRISTDTQNSLLQSDVGIQGLIGNFGLSKVDDLKKSTTSGAAKALGILKESRGLLGRINLNDENSVEKGLSQIREKIKATNELSGLEKELRDIETESFKRSLERTSVLEKQTQGLEELNTQIKIQKEFLESTEYKKGIDKLFGAGFIGSEERLSRLAPIREREIKSRDFSGAELFKNAGSDFLSGFDYNSTQFFLDVQKGAVDTAQTIKSEFSGAFKEFARGTKDAGTAFRDFALNVAFSVQDKLIDIGINSLLGSVFGGSTGGLGKLFKSGGGKIGRYSDGGLVTGGSGIADDVAAKLSPGDFVMQRSAVSKYGIDSFAGLNSGVDISLGNSFNYNNPNSPSGGSASISPFLSSFGLDDTNNPQNTLRDNRVENLRSYLGERSAYELQKSDAISKFNSQKRQQLIGTYISAALAGFGSIARGGISAQKPVTGTVTGNFGYGGDRTLNLPPVGRASGGAIFGNDSASDTVPAYLTAGEYVIKRSAASKIGYNNLELMNQGKFPRFAYGGGVGTNLSSDSSGESLLKLISLNEQLNKAFLDFSLNKNGSNNPSAPIGSQSPVSVVVNVNTNVDSQNNVKSDATASTTGEGNKISPDNSKQLADGIRSVVLDEILKQSRPGGLLAR